MPDQSVETNENGYASKTYNANSRSSGLFGNNGIRFTGFLAFAMAILGWFGVLGLGELRDNYHENRGAEIVDINEVNILRNAERKLGKHHGDIDSVGEGWIAEGAKGIKKKSKKEKVTKMTKVVFNDPNMDVDEDKERTNMSEFKMIGKGMRDSDGFDNFEEENEKQMESFRFKKSAKNNRVKLPPINDQKNRIKIVGRKS
jgi:hypothetical protein